MIFSGGKDMNDPYMGLPASGAKMAYWDYAIAEVLKDQYLNR